MAGKGNTAEWVPLRCLSLASCCSFELGESTSAAVSVLVPVCLVPDPLIPSFLAAGDFAPSSSARGTWTVRPADTANKVNGLTQGARGLIYRGRISSLQHFLMSVGLGETAV